jgi:hypothetical protein
MVDKERRKKLAFHLRHLAVGLISNDEFENYITDDVTFGWLPEQYYRSKEAKFDDLIIQPMLELSWCLYSDLKEHKLTGHYKLSNEQLKDITRFILFLQSDFEYEWSYLDPTNPLIKFSFKDLLLSVWTLGQYYRNKINERKQQLNEFEKSGNFEYWPFIIKEQYEEQLKHQPFFTGRKKELT